MTALSLPPQDLEAEMSLLGSMLIDADCVDDVLGVIGRTCSEAMYGAGHRQVFDAVTELHCNDVPIDVVTLEAELRRRGHLEDVGGRAYLFDLTGSVPSSANAVHYAKIVRDKWRLRCLISVGHRLQQEATASDAAPETLLHRVEDQLLRLHGLASTVEPERASDIGREVIDAAMNGTAEPGLSTGFAALDHALNGLRPGQLVTLAARPAVGKTSLAIQVAGHVAGSEGTPVLFVSLEMPAKAIVRRLLAQRSSIDGAKLLRPGELSEMDMETLKAQHLPRGLFVIAGSGLTVPDIRAQARRLKRRHGLALVVLDYLGLLRDPAAERHGRTAVVTNLSRDMKGLAVELEIPVLVLHQLNRAPANERAAPQLHHLRDSGSVEQDSDVVMFLHQAEVLDDNKPRPLSWRVWLLIRKNREGPTGNVVFTFHPRSTTFVQGGQVIDVGDLDNRVFGEACDSELAPL